MLSTVEISFNQFLAYLQTYLQKSTEMTTHRCCHKKLLEVVPSDLSIRKLGVQHLRKFRDHMIGVGLSRKTIREYLNKTIRWVGFCWERGQVSQATYLACKSIWMPNPRQGRPPVRTRPVSWTDIQCLLPHLPEPLANLIQLHWWTAARPCEVVQINHAHITKSSANLWLWNLKDHKNMWRGQERILFLNSKCINILQTITPANSGYFFPSAKNKSGFISRLTYQRQVKKNIMKKSINGIINNPEWTIRGIRNGRARAMQQLHGLEATRVLLGHNDQRMTSHYAGLSIPSPEFIYQLE